ncbi:hatching enzyme 1b precursor [Silurus asotus]|uniref:Metalloendopeptidase n=1 Tax=Silurus asotus TaxID=30991 RepID=A0AAD5FFD3_SILAS|nr:hatching enzyme 1b precursor [Silurus asotus]
MEMDLLQLQMEEKRLLIKKAALEIELLEHRLKAQVQAATLMWAKQAVSLSRFGCVDQGIVKHELNHALGFYHKHVRSDRDKYVTINWENIDPTTASNFDLKNTNNDDYSVMHYGNTAFSINGLDTITPTSDPSVKIGQRQELPTRDIKRINIFYNC